MLQDDILHIKYPNGKMMINCPEFFPAEKGRLRKLLKVIDSGYGKDAAENRKLLSSWLKVQLDKASDMDNLRRLANGAVDCGTQASEYQERVEKQIMLVDRLTEARKGKKKSSPEAEALKAGKKKLKELKEKQKLYLSWKRDYEKEFEECRKKADRLKANIEMVEEGSRE